MKKATACWDGYTKMGTKKKGNKTVNNCVPTGKSKPKAKAKTVAKTHTMPNGKVMKGASHGR